MPTDPRTLARILDSWLDDPLTKASLASARDALERLAAALVADSQLRDELSPYLVNVFLRTGYLKDYRILSRWARALRRPELLDEVDAVVRAELPDVWVLSALKRGETDVAVDFWFEHEDHPRARLCAAALIKACPERIDVLVSGRLSTAAYHIGRGNRSRYRKACRVLADLRSELQRRGEAAMWSLALEDILARYGHRPALMDEFEKAGIT